MTLSRRDLLLTSAAAVYRVLSWRQRSLTLNSRLLPRTGMATDELAVCLSCFCFASSIGNS